MLNHNLDNCSNNRTPFESLLKTSREQMNSVSHNLELSDKL